MSDYGRVVGDAMKAVCVLGAVITVAATAFGYLAGRLVSSRLNDDQEQKTVALATQALDKDAKAEALENLTNTPKVVSANEPNNSPKLKAHAITAGCTILGGCVGIAGAVALLRAFVPKINF